MRSPEQQKIEFLEQRVQELHAENQKLNTKLDGIDDIIKKSVDEKTSAYDKLNSQSVASFNSLVSLLQAVLIIASFLIAVMTWVGWNNLTTWIQNHVKNEAEKQIKDRVTDNFLKQKIDERVSDDFLASKIDAKSQAAMEKLDTDVAAKAEQLFVRYETDLKIRLAEATKDAEEIAVLRRQNIQQPLSTQQQASAERLEAKAEQVPEAERTEDDWFLLGLQATYKSDHQTALECFEKVQTAGGLGNAALAAEKTGQNDKAELLYQHAIELDPMFAHTLAGYAGFLVDFREDYTEAETLYLRALTSNPLHSNTRGNYAQLLFISGRNEEAKEQLKQIESNKNYGVDLDLEINFYRYAHLPEERDIALTKLKAILNSDARSQGWDFSKNIIRAEQDAHPELKFMERLADVINGKESIEILNQFMPWTTAITN
ncbi:hypothetical protein [uncultured Deefgea sp.]|uniref:hypothetical protein n=1 Tax=uncultured Deefgea sp. TaxID=1304914 RepID=UPI0026346C85|nr:hypothetical protein [uncultured Deefgea sp.]